MNQENIVKKLLGGDADVIPVVTPIELEELDGCEIPDELPLMPLRNTVMFPGIVIPVSVGREKSLRLVNACNRKKSLLGVITQKDEEVEDPGYADLHSVGVVSKILKRYNMPDGGVTVIIQGIRLFRLDAVVDDDPFLTGRITPLSTNDDDESLWNSDEFKATISSLSEVTSKCFRLSGGTFSIESLLALKNIGNPSFLVNFIASNLQTPVESKQRILEELDLQQRARMVLQEQNRCLRMEELKAQIQNKTRVEMDKQQKEYMLNQQLKVIQDELGDNGNDQALDELRKSRHGANGARMSANSLKRSWASSSACTRCLQTIRCS